MTCYRFLYTSLYFKLFFLVVLFLFFVCVGRKVLADTWTTTWCGELELTFWRAGRGLQGGVDLNFKLQCNFKHHFWLLHRIILMNWNLVLMCHLTNLNLMSWIVMEWMLVCVEIIFGVFVSTCGCENWVACDWIYVCGVWTLFWFVESMFPWRTKSTLHCLVNEESVMWWNSYEYVLLVWFLDMAWSVSDYWLCHVIEGWCQNLVFLDPKSIGSMIWCFWFIIGMI